MCVRIIERVHELICVTGLHFLTLIRWWVYSRKNGVCLCLCFDRLMDLFVGAPLFMDRGSDGKLKEVGQVSAAQPFFSPPCLCWLHAQSFQRRKKM